MKEYSPRRNPYFIGILSAIEVREYILNIKEDVAILILLESFLQFENELNFSIKNKCRNPYFIGILSAI